MVPERGDLDLPPKSEFIEVFAQELQNWEYEGAWAIENKNELLVTNSEYGGVAWQCLNWKDYSFEFDTKICNKFTSWIVRAQNARTYVMLQCHPTRIYPHFCVNKHWTKIEWTGQNPLKLPITLPIDTWFHVRIEVKNFDVTITFLIDGKDYSVPTIKDLLQPPIAPIEYGIGSIGFRCSGDEAAFFRNISVHMI
jgi:hypothetical protein